ncbi:MAG: M18 family aminopeptidase [Spirochaetia bacterium]|jgi:aspartyl aminopeptidase|nr:M18 family aminopeptidase [Spirochaetia bacterium]
MENLQQFIQRSPSSYQAAETIVNQLKVKGFKLLDEREAWTLKPGKSYYIIRNMSSVIAFRLGLDKLSDSGFMITGAHTDSPSLKLKSEGGNWKEGSARLSTEVYGAPILSSWLDRELSIAGVVTVRKDGIWSRILFNHKKPVAIVPNLAIHINREVNKAFEYNKQDHLQAVLGISKSKEDPLRTLVSRQLDIESGDLGEMDLFLYDPGAGSFLGDEYFVSPRIDNLAMCHSILSAITSSMVSAATQVAVFYDNEEVGSLTYQGANSSFLSEILERIVYSNKENTREDYFRAKAASFLISADGAHAVHPNFSDKHDPDYSPKLNKGPVIKLNAAFKYATSSETALVFQGLCEDLSIPFQKFIGRSDMPSGSTIGAISAANLGIRTVDVGNPMWAMHSIRETYGMRDHKLMNDVLTHYYNKGISRNE